jgi:hypothetical protein
MVAAKLAIGKVNVRHTSKKWSFYYHHISPSTSYHFINDAISLIVSAIITIINISNISTIAIINISTIITNNNNEIIIIMK